MRPLSRILIVKADRFYAEAMHQSTSRIFPGAHIRVVNQLAEANAALSTESFDMMISGIGLPDGDMLDLLAACTGVGRRVEYVLVVTARREPRVWESLNALA